MQRQLRNKLRTIFVGYNVGDGTADPNRDKRNNN